jgi:hypothetical protein
VGETAARGNPRERSKRSVFVLREELLGIPLKKPLDRLRRGYFFAPEPSRTY